MGFGGGVPRNWGTFLGCSYDQEYTAAGSILAPPMCIETSILRREALRYMPPGFQVRVMAQPMLNHHLNSLNRVF